ncbi:zinc-dependent metalloprotease [Rheinheimera sp. 4Y26]|uniref:zinc-dependent metalloprotease n=1 Tax=Rheinheimera sp. 4Y26 TaxID=2977811 RepID=UPI0021B0EE98|nr:zinc-dependent metalloprotease [Rheinheimera sp. 4Y26]MCT6700004.1 zinc-dependent metalloprotease [Rheinheimera sp. 4Y26]
MKLVPLTGLLLLTAGFYSHADTAALSNLALSGAAVTQDQLPTVATFTKGMKQQQGYFDFYYDERKDKVYLKVDKLNQPFIFQSSLPRGLGSNDIGLDRGQLGDTRLVQFEQYGNKVMLKQLNTYYRAESENQAERLSVEEAFASSVLAGLPVVAAEKGQLLVDYSEFLWSDIHQISSRLSAQNQGNFSPDKDRSGVYLARSKAFPRNTELEAMVTYSGSKAGEFVTQVTPAADAITVHLHHSLVALPEEGYQKRRFHPYSGFWKVEYMDYATAFDEPITQRLLPRHRLVKKDPKATLSEAVQPIVYYLDPGVPEPVRTALKEGALWWNSAYEKIGYKNAFQVKDLPKDADPMDVRYNVIQWVHRATRGWSYGYGVTDPRTGEIIKGHVTLGSLRVRQDFLIATGLTAPYQQNGSADSSNAKAMALARIRQLSAHEVGHTLGLIHNFAGSANGRSTVMDYPHPLVDLRSGHITLDNAYREGLGEWDYYAIAYGYGDHSDAERLALVQNAKQQGLEYMADEDARPQGGVSAKGHLWDNGADAVAELRRLGEVRKQALTQFGLNNIRAGQPLSALQEALVPIYALHRYQVEAAVKLIAGAYYQYELKGDYENAKGFQWVEPDKQQQALDAILATIKPDYLLLPAELLALIPPKAFGDSDGRESFSGRYGLAFDPISAAEAAANHSLSLLLHPQRLNRLSGQQQLQPMLAKLLDATLRQPWPAQEQAGSSAQALVQQRVGHVAFYQLMQSLTAADTAPEARAIVRSELMQLAVFLQKQSNASQQLLLSQWQQYLQSGKWQPVFVPKELPPGAPI